ncbi:ELMO/CED-12 family-domain-containing protein [Protomyces lactucae-debilis]|uniref:ELMO/CED-12 family-domain-containing protein n=1 Tax=Protomyces lactucae-debilis TaxID=2754530 RepID=A0A1Y2FP34_PROLT|nr:ELMO/CED-12 family-domain-containing protein [Protomyces lactucae-debilis]ORY85094.1 ELMO/CED-12 family-domain-containing protein [Protomyces lactucae-debilis]
MARDLQIASSRHAGSQGSNATRGKHWDALGFQGEDPSTDFRATGKLGLRHVSHFCQAHPIYATRMIKESGTAAVTIEGPWYPFALCAIHITALLLTVVKLGSMQRHWLQAAARDPVDGVAALSDKLFSYLFVRCHLDWCEGVDKKEITSILEFEVFFADFAAYIQRDLQTRHRENDDFHVAALKWW